MERMKETLIEGGWWGTPFCLDTWPLFTFVMQPAHESGVYDKAKRNSKKRQMMTIIERIRAADHHKRRWQHYSGEAGKLCLLMNMNA